MTRSFDAPRKLVWEAMMWAELIRKWIYAPEGWAMVVCEGDVRVGGGVPLGVERAGRGAGERNGDRHGSGVRSDGRAPGLRWHGEPRIGRRRWGASAGFPSMPGGTRVYDKNRSAAG